LGDRLAGDLAEPHGAHCSHRHPSTPPLMRSSNTASIADLERWRCCFSAKFVNNPG
jgi:hypothetical protein